MIIVKCHSRPTLSDALRRADGRALTYYYYGYFAAGAETV